MTKVAIIQSSYIPWKGFFDIINEVDIFVFLDDVQYTVRDWRSRNKIKLANGTTKWLSVPVTGGRNQLICEARIDNSQKWKNNHLNTMRQNYGKAPYFKNYFSALEEIYNVEHEYLYELNQCLTKKIAEWLGITTRFDSSTELESTGSKDDKLIQLVKAVGGDHYLSGPSARNYIVPEKFKQNNIALAFHDYPNYPEYQQISKPFEHFVSVLDLLFMLGSEAPEFIWGKHV